MNATRLYTLKFGQKGQVFSIGRVQTPTLAMIVNRQLEIDAFSSSKFWEIRTLYREVYFACTLGKIETNEKGSEWMEQIEKEELEVVNYEQKEGKEIPPSLFDLTSLQVECNKRFGFSAEETLNMVQKLYEQKLVTYPRVDTTYLSDDIYPKIADILGKLTYYKRFTDVLLSAPIKKSKKVFDNTKVTDHHAIIPTGIAPSGITPDENKVYDAISRRFIAAFYPDCKVSNTVVEAQVNTLEFRASGRQVLDMGWRTVYADYGANKAKEEGEEEEQIMPIFTKGERGPHLPELQEKSTKPPKYYNEGSLLRAMETAGKAIDDDDLRELMKENGIGRPSTRANIIETLNKRGYIKKDKKRIMATPLGIHLISLIDNDLLKSAELTGQWEKKLRDIEKGTYSVETFKEELITMVAQVCHEVKHQFAKPQPIICPKCQTGELISGKSAWGCSRWKEGCKLVIPFDFEGIRLSEGDLRSLINFKKSRYKFPFKDKKGVETKSYVTLTDKLKLALLKE
jgi:DNA topoisomerase-3